MCSNMPRELKVQCCVGKDRIRTDVCRYSIHHISCDCTVHPENTFLKVFEDIFTFLRYYINYFF